MTQNIEQVRIDFQKKIKPIIKFGFAVQAFLLFIALVLFFYTGFLYWKNEPFFSLLFFVTGIFIYWIGKKYLANIYYKEYILIDNRNLEIVFETSKARKKVFEIDKIKELGFVGEIDFTQHPMDNNVIDFTGLGVAEKEVQFLIDDGTMQIETDNEKFRFGKNIPSWEAERIISLIKEKVNDRIKTY